MGQGDTCRGLAGARYLSPVLFMDVGYRSTRDVVPLVGREDGLSSGTAVSLFARRTTRGHAGIFSRRPACAALARSRSAAIAVLPCTPFVELEGRAPRGSALSLVRSLHPP